MAEKNFKTENEDFLDEELGIEEDASYNRKSVDGIKRILILLFLLMCAVPILFCLYLLVKMNGIERKVDILLERPVSKAKITTEEVVSENDPVIDMRALDQEAYLDLEKNTESVTQNLSASMIEKGYSPEKRVTNGKKVYLTFDDGPSQYTGEILDILKANDIRATFFVVKSENEDYWKYYTDIVEDGNTLAMHSYSHVYEEVYESEESFEKDVQNIHDFLYDQTGVDCRYYRFPGGSSNSVSDVDIYKLIEYLDSKGITYFDWNALSGDAVDDELSPDELNETVLEYVRSNESDSIVLLHDLDYKRETVDGLQSLIDTLKEEGYEIMPIDMTTTPVQHVTK